MPFCFFWIFFIPSGAANKDTNIILLVVTPDFFIRVNKYTKDPNTNLPNPELVFEENEEIICNYETNFIPVDPTICLFSPVFTKEVYEELYPLANSPSSNLVSSETEGFGYDENSAKIWNFFNVGMEPYVNKNFTLNSQSEENAGGTIVVGRLMNLYVNIDFLLDIYQNYYI